MILCFTFSLTISKRKTGIKRKIFEKYDILQTNKIKYLKLEINIFYVFLLKKNPKLNKQIFVN